MHVRRGDRGWKRFTVPARIRARLAAWGVADGSVVFILSDERAPGFWEPLKEHYDLVRYADCPRLAGLVSGADGCRPDNYLLYEVEKEIMRNAALRIETYEGRGPTDAHGALVPSRRGAGARFRIRLAAGRALRAARKSLEQRRGRLRGP